MAATTPRTGETRPHPRTRPRSHRRRSRAAPLPGLGGATISNTRSASPDQQHPISNIPGAPLLRLGGRHASRNSLSTLHCGCGGLRLRFPSTSGRPPPLIGGYSRRYASASSRFTAAAADCGGDHHKRSPFPVFTWLGRLHIFICCLLSLPSLGLGDSTSSPSWVASFLCKLPQHLRLRQLLLRQSQQL